MKVAIIEDTFSVICYMVATATKAGHEVLGINVSKGRPEWAHTDPNQTAKLTHTMNLDEAARAVKAFDPDVVFIDHDLGLCMEDGETFALKLGFPGPKCVGTSSYPQPYCGQKMRSNKRTFKDDPLVGQEFLGLIR